ncbi:MAG: hypothetical protein AABY04_01010, partial [Candidatus Micrarchaeota archaeon]
KFGYEGFRMSSYVPKFDVSTTFANGTNITITAYTKTMDRALPPGSKIIGYALFRPITEQKLPASGEISIPRQLIASTIGGAKMKFGYVNRNFD